MGTVALTVADPGRDSDELPPLGPEVKVKTVSIDVPVEDLEWLERYAEYRNAIAAVEAAETKTKAHRQNSRKSITEMLLRTEIARRRVKMSVVIGALGPLPEATDREAMEKYARRWLARQKK